MLDFEKYWSLSIDYLLSNPLILVGLAIGAVIFLYKKPVEFVKFTGFIALIITILYIMSLLTQSGTMGSQYKKSLKQRSESAITQ